MSINLNLPAEPVPDRVSIAGGAGSMKPGERRTFAELDGPGCIRHIWVTMCRGDHANRQCVIRIFFDGAQIPHVEAPVSRILPRAFCP